MRAIWANWHDGEELAFTGKFYTHTLMTPFFTPTDTEYGAPRVFLAAVGPMMTEVAGEVADGVICHAFTTEKYLRETTLPALERGFAKAGKTRADFEISYPVFVVTGKNDLQIEVANTWVNRLIGDEQLPLDSQWHDWETLSEWPSWFGEKTKRPSGRYTFTSARHYNKNSTLMPSGLLGP